MPIDFEALFGQDEYDPCAALRAMRPAFMQLASGQGEQKITFRDRDVWFHRADLSQFRALIAQLESECAAKNGTTRQRFAITAGARRTYG
jgi:hypothetical protein